MSATYNSSKCDRCTKQDVCKYKDHYKALVSEMTKYIETKDTNLITNSSIGCNFYKDNGGSFR